ncbi:Crp/Fnr family transcriptional regulator [Streptococcus uberis]|uniref:Crp/Fnr family transcriptional regulator n=1 Tax=Streptococcus uberis TaxID=1349 RepID=UPI0022B8DAD2|nr:Crp/Fnr family transcriptional regulator [Streptococcus uberis]MCZ8466531.1 Crp/Fnr family transcriptional regulator [Streptococcus uberis]
MVENHHRCISLVPLFNHLQLEDQALIEAEMTHKDFGKNEIIFSPSQPAQLTLVAKGNMKVYRLSGNGKEQLLRISEPGDYEGDHFLMGVTNENLFGQALTDTRVCILEENRFMALLEKYPPLALQLMKINASRMNQLEEQTQFLSMERVDERLAYYLLQLAKANQSSFFEIPMKLKELATFLGTSSETLSRKLKQLESEGYIERYQKTIKILDMEGLEDY